VNPKSVVRLAIGLESDDELIADPDAALTTTCGSV
jgi:cystathionine beta-lyase/cystathionine gamma-synthase